jgi:calcineurin-like phosphoesterase family protein
MTTRIFVIADTHFGHTNAWAKFKLADGVTPLRPFSSTEEMDETMVARWNEVVRPQDHVYHLGDVTIAKRNLSIVKRLNGHKRLVRGNHDIFRTADYIAVGFEEIYGVRVWPAHGTIMSHIPLHPDCLRERQWKNLHGHLHANHVRGDNAQLYKCVSVEQIDYRPILAFVV